MLGLGVRRLKTRPSLLDLIASRQPAQTEEREEEEHQGNEEKGPSSSPPGPDQLPPLPVSPASASSDSSVLHPSTSLSTVSIHPSPPVPRTMSSKRGADTDEAAAGAVFSVSGPVVVAENMIGCAMYELVCRTPDSLCLCMKPPIISITANLLLSVESVMTCSSVKSSVSTPIRPPSRFTKKRVPPHPSIAPPQLHGN